MSVFSPNAGKYGPEKTPYFDIFHAVSGLFRYIPGDSVVSGSFCDLLHLNLSLFMLSLLPILNLNITNE